MSWTLIAQSEALGGQPITIDRDMVIGRQQQADIVVQAAHVSRRHAALLLKDDGSLWIEDLGSANGTRVNEHAISAPQQLHNGDRISLQDLHFQVVQTDAELQPSHAHSDISTAQPTETMVFKPSDKGMPTLEERSQDLNIRPDGMPQNIGIPKPAPIPTDAPVVRTTTTPEPTATPVDEKKATHVGLMTFISIIILAVLAAAYHFMHG